MDRDQGAVYYIIQISSLVARGPIGCRHGKEIDRIMFGLDAWWHEEICFAFQVKLGLTQGLSDASRIVVCNL